MSHPACDTATCSSLSQDDGAKAFHLFDPADTGFRRRTRLVNELMGHWPVIAGTGSLLEAHLIARLALNDGLISLIGCGTSEQQVWTMVHCQCQQGQPLLLVLSDSIAADHGQHLIGRIRRVHRSVLVLLLVQQQEFGPFLRTEEYQAQAIVHVESFGSGTLIRALQALRRRQRYLDPRLHEQLALVRPSPLSAREMQVLQGLARGLTNKTIALEMAVASTTVRGYVSSLMRKLGARNRTEALARGIALGLVPEKPILN